MTAGGLLRAVLLVAALLDFAGCDRSKSRTTSDEAPLVVFAAASLTNVFTRLAPEFERRHPNVRVTFNFAGTQELRTQLEHGATADVFAAADWHAMRELVRSSRVSEPLVLAHNEPVLVVAAESATTVQRFQDLTRADHIVVGAPEVPIGRYTQQIIERASLVFGAPFRAAVESKVVSRELNVRQVLTKVTLGEAQVAFVYRTDALAAGDRVRVVPIPPELNVTAEYPIALVNRAEHPELARAWLELLFSDVGQQALEDAGFRPARPRSESAP